MAEERTYTIGQLAEAAGVTPRTIRYYTAEELLPPPDSRGKYALYSEDHLLRLRLIARLKEAYLPLGEIKARLGALSPEQVAALLAEYEEAPAPSSAADYIAQLLAGKTTAHAVAERAPEYPARQAAAASQPPPHAALSAPRLAPPAPRLPSGVGRVEPAAAPAPAAPAPGEQAEESGGLLGRLVRRAKGGAPAPVEAGERWRRVPL
ncbi:MAG TPA: MerR family transcriptional regulator, partial [Roseiflexaceae bacterium]|nr:MerR family transcriptional regulator [Roseiflexaceae bacterium]